jgi:hypothetical protein
MLKIKLESLLREASSYQKLEKILNELDNQAIKNIDRQNAVVRLNKGKAKEEIAKSKLLQSQVEIRDPEIVQNPMQLTKRYQQLKVRKAEVNRAGERVHELGNLARKKSQQTEKGGDPLTWNKN